PERELLKKGAQLALRAAQLAGPWLGSLADRVNRVLRGSYDGVVDAGEAAVTDVVVSSGDGTAFTVAGRVVNQLADSRLGALAGKLSPQDIVRLANNPSAQRFLDARNRSINVIQQV